MPHRLTDRIRALFVTSHCSRTRRVASCGLTTLLCGLGFLCEPLEARAQVTTLSVVNTSDSGSGSLREAVDQANASPGAEIIEFTGSLFTDANPDVILLTGGRITISDDLTLQGTGANLLTLSAGGQSQLLYVTGAATDVTIDGLSLTGGSAAGSTIETQSGGAIFNNDSQLVLSNSVLAENSAAFDGGGLYNQSGTVTLTGNTVTGNTTVRGGGGLASNGMLIVTSSGFADNVAPFGGAIANGQLGTLDLADSSFTGNSASVDGAGVLNFYGSATIQSSHFEANASVRGGTVSNYGDLLLADSSFVGNSATYGGGAANVEAGTMTVVGGTFLENTATRDGGGLFNSTGGDMLVFDSTLLSNSGDLVGGAIANVRAGRIRVQGSTLAGNFSNLGGAIANIYGAEMIVSNSTISGNLAGDSGGGVLNDGVLTFYSSTIVLNQADRPQGGGAGVFTNTDPGVVTRLFNTIVAGNVRRETAGLVPNNLGGNPVDAQSAYNLIGAPDPIGGFEHGVNGNIVGAAGPNGTRVLLPLSQILDLALADNGGPTQTHALVAGSVVIDAGSDALAVSVDDLPLTTDQRGGGFARILGASVDIGAFER